MKIEPNKTYLTAGGYVVEIDNYLMASPETSPGINVFGKTCAECMAKGRKDGWSYFSDGIVPNCSEEWMKKLTIIKELPFKLPKLKDGFQWAGGFPQYRVPKVGEQFIGACYGNSFSSEYYTNNATRGLIYNERLIVEPILSNVGDGYRQLKEHEVYTNAHECSKDDGKTWHKCINSGRKVYSCPRWIFREKIQVSDDTEKEVKHIPFSGPGKYMLANGQIVNFLRGCVCHKSDGILSKNGACIPWVWNPDGTIGGLGFDDHSHLYLTKKIEEDSVVNMSIPSTEHSVCKTDEYILITQSVYILRPNIDECKRSNRNWEKVIVHNKFGTDLDKWRRDGWEFRCKIKDYPPLFIVGDHDFGKRGITNLCVEKVSASALTTNSYGAVSPKISDEKKKRSFVMSSANVLRFATVKAILLTVLAFMGKWAWRGANYWAFEPVKEVATKIMRAVRYATLTATIAGGVYAYNSPEDAKKFFWDCIPKISVEFESPEILKG